MLVRIHLNELELPVNLPNKEYPEPFLDELMDQLRIKLEKIKEEHPLQFEQIVMIEIEDLNNEYAAHLYFTNHESGSMIIYL